MSGIHVTSEIGPLKKVLLHRPGKELLNLTPDTLEELLFDDIPFLEDAMKEHDAFANVLRENDVEVVYLEDLMTEVLELSDSIKEEFIEQFMEEADIHSYKERAYLSRYLNSLNQKELVLKTMEGIRRDSIPELKTEPHPLKNLPKEEFLLTKPMPNLYFTRDNFASVGVGVDLHKMYSKTRNRECIYSEYIFKYHKDYKDVPKYYKREYPWHTEGGDLSNLNEHTVMIGISQRTEKEAIEQLAKNFFENPKCKIDTVLAIAIPSNRAYMHLDTVFTQIDKYTFTYHPGILSSLQVLEIKEGKNPNSKEDLLIEEKNASLDKILEMYLNHPVKLIPCANGDPIASEREQWNDGSNTLCIAPGVVVVYDRNTITNNLLRQEGIKVIEIHASELSRGRGGPRCMSMPLIREDILW